MSETTGPKLSISEDGKSVIWHAEERDVVIELPKFNCSTGPLVPRIMKAHFNDEGMPVFSLRVAAIELDFKVACYMSSDDKGIGSNFAGVLTSLYDDDY